jgi:MFS family permease
MPFMDEATEASPLIPVGDADRQEPAYSHTNDSEWTRDGVQTAALAAFFILLFAVADVFRYFSTLQLLELGVCHEQYTAANPDVPKQAAQNIPGDFCGSPAVQQYVADLRGYLVALEALVGLFLTLPYGLLVNRCGERLVAGLSLLGVSIACAWVLLVSFSKSALPIWTAVLAPLFQVIGGGSPVLYSVLYSIAAKHIPDSSR